MRARALEAPRRALRLAYARLTSSTLHKLYTSILIVYVLTLLILHSVSLNTTSSALNRLSTLLALANVDSGTLVTSFTSQDGQPALRLCNKDNAADCQVIPASPDASTPLQVASTNAPPLPVTTAQQANAQPTGVSDVNVLPGGVSSSAVSVVPKSSTTSTTSTTSVSSSTSTVSSSSSTSTSPVTSSSSAAAVIADVQKTTSSTTTNAQKDAQPTGEVSSTEASNPAVTSAPTLSLVLLPDEPETASSKVELTTSVELSTTIEAASSTSSESVRETSRTTEAGTSTRSKDAAATRITTTSSESSTSTSSIATKKTSRVKEATSSTSSATTTTTSREPTSTEDRKSTSEPRPSADVTANDVTLSESTTRTLPSLVRPEIITPTPTPASSSLAISDAAHSSGASSSTIPASESAASESSSSVEKEILTPSRSTETGAEEPTETAKGGSKAAPVRLLRRSFSAAPVHNDTTGAVSALDLTDLADDGGNAVTRVSVVCALAMAFPTEQLQYLLMEGLFFIGYHLWIGWLGLTALSVKSIPHLFTALLASMMALIWSGTQIIRSRSLQDQFTSFITRGACGGTDVLPFYWVQRQRIEIAILAFNLVALLILCGASYKVAREYWRERNGSLHPALARVMRLLRITMLLGSYILVGSLTLWIHEVFKSPVAVLSNVAAGLKGLGILSLLLVVPWIIFGWRAPAAEGYARKRWMMVGFLAISLFFLGGWTVVFASDLYRAVFIRWPFFAVVSVASFFILVVSLGSGILCLMRLGRAIPHEVIVEKQSSPEMMREENTKIEARGADEEIVDPTVLRDRWDYSNKAERAWEPFEAPELFRQSQFTSSDRQSSAFSYGLRSPVPPMPPMRLPVAAAGAAAAASSDVATKYV